MIRKFNNKIRSQNNRKMAPVTRNSYKRTAKQKLAARKKKCKGRFQSKIGQHFDVAQTTTAMPEDPIDVVRLAKHRKVS